MEKHELRLIRDPPEAARCHGQTGGRWGSFALTAYLVAIASAATLLGADAAREPIASRERAESALADSLERGNRAPEVVRALIELRTAISRRPLDSKTRIAYASLLLGLSRQLEDAGVAAFHAARAATLAPATLSVVRPAVLIEAYAGHTAEAARLVRSIFSFEPQRAAASLAEIEPYLDTIDQALPDEPAAWLAWQAELARRERGDEAEAWLARIHERWPDYLPAVERLVDIAVERGDWDRVAQLLPPEPWPERPEMARLRLRRARWHALQGDAAAARADAARALEEETSSATLFLAGEVSEALGDVDEARHRWNRGMFMLGREQPHVRGWFHERLARLEDEHGQPAAALRHWRAVLEIDPAHAVARRRADDLSGFSRP